MGIQRIPLESKLSKQEGFLTISSPMQLDLPSFPHYSSQVHPALRDPDLPAQGTMMNYAGYPSSHGLVRWELMTKANRKVQPWAGIFFPL